MNIAQIKKSFRELPADVQLGLLYELWDQLAEDSHVLELTPEQQAELERRDAELVADPSIAVSWEQVKRETRGVIEPSSAGRALATRKSDR